MNKLVAPIVCLIWLAGCDSQPPTPDNAAAPAPQENYQERVAALPPGQREEVLHRAIIDAGRKCPEVEAVDPHAPIKGATAWKVQCDNRLDWIVVIGETGTAVVTSEEELRLNGVAADKQ
jgi:hypothetical protein